MKKSSNLLLIGMLSVTISYAQNKTDSIISIPEVAISAYTSKQLLLHSASSISFIEQRQIREYVNQSLVSLINSIAGLRMEERSPGSYRLSIRGSLLRSPFGIRNIKIYLDEFPLTDAGGNTYLNLINANSINSIQILKGPEGSMFGANTGGVILLNLENKSDSSIAEASVRTGSFSMFDEQVYIDKKWKYYSLNINQAFQHSDGYRQNSALKRNYLQALQKWNYKKGTVKLLLIGSQLHYETPGGLNLSQSEEDPRQARPATSSLPGAKEQRAGVYNSTLYGGISNKIYLLPILKHVIALFGSYTDFNNLFITNYETKKEQTFGLRTYLELGKKRPVVDWKWNIGFEWQQTKSATAINDNNSGSKGVIQSSDDLNASQSFIFSQFSALINTRLELEAALSLNNYQINYKNIFPDDENTFTTTKMNGRLMPRIGFSYRIINNLVWRASVSKGYSPPSLAELRPSDNILYSSLQPEYGWNYETGLRFRSSDQRFDAVSVVFKFDLKNAIVRKTNDTGTEYFINAGGTNQMGLEFQFFRELVKYRFQGFIRGLEFRNSFTYYDFTFADYSNNLVSFSGRKLTGVPKFVNVSSLNLFFPKKFNLFLSYNYTDKTPLNDGNSVYSTSYQLFGSKLSWEYKHKNSFTFNLFGGAENILNVSYSLGNDLNAAGNRYYNPAPARTYYCGIQIRF
jgi:iron complex outermembrane receptor protein